MGENSSNSTILASALDNLTKEHGQGQLNVELACVLSPAPDVRLYETARKAGVTEKCCEVCGVGNARCCTNCRQVSYCGKEHQLKHWKIHKGNCFPVKAIARSSCSIQVGQGNVQGRDPNYYLVATRDIKEGETFFQEDAILTSPGPWDSDGIEVANGKPICVSCCEIIQKDDCELDDSDDENCTTRCSHCQWPVCNYFCETAKRHSDYECKLLSSGRVSTMVLNQMPDYECILVLRALLLKENNPEKWMRLMNLEPPLISCIENDLSSSYLNSAVKFIREVCGLRQYTDSLIRQVASICFLHSLSNDDHPGENGYIYKIATYIGEMSSKVAHSCVANSEWSVIPAEEDEIRFRSLVPIKAGECISIVYNYKSTCHQGTALRQQFLYEHYFFKCSCERCRDPTELQTYCSALKCSSEICCGYFLPLNPCDPSSDWKCNSSTCLIVKPKSWVDKILSRVVSELEAYPYTDPMRPMRNKKNSDAKKAIVGLKKIIDKFRGSPLHQNHYLLVAAEWKIMENGYQIIMGVKNYCSEVVNFVMSIGKKHLDLYDKLSPGLSRRRGFIFYYTQAGLLENLRHETVILTKNQRKQIADKDPEKLSKLRKNYFEMMRMRSESTKIFSFKGVIRNSVEEELVNYSAPDQPFMLCLKFLEQVPAETTAEKV